MINYILLGIIQGVFEWLPISSEGVTALFSQFFVQRLNPIDIALFLHLGTLLATLVYFSKEWIKVLTGKNPFLLRFLIIATIISLVVGFPVYKTIRSLAIGYTLLLIMGFGLLCTSFFQKSQRKIKIGVNGLAIITGFLQGLAVIPGLSRSGSTIFGLSLGKFPPEDILKISYMMSAPVILVSTLYLWWENPILFSQGWLSLIFSFLVGFATLHLLINLAQKINFSKFTFVFGLFCLIGAVIGLLF
ncbi:undecaprenyl-diphosphate phosphatase [bacterium]|nr:undecaprenyl-diphosphate phosphatase [bacterium]